MNRFFKAGFAVTLVFAIGYTPMAEAGGVAALAKLILKLGDSVVTASADTLALRAADRRAGLIFEAHPDGDSPQSTLDAEWIMQQLGPETGISQEDAERMVRFMNAEPTAEFSAADELIFHEIVRALLDASVERTYQLSPICVAACQMNALKKIRGTENRWELTQRATQAHVDQIQQVLRRMCKNETSIQVCAGTQPDNNQVTMSCREGSISFSLAGETKLKAGDLSIFLADPIDL